MKINFITYLIVFQSACRILLKRFNSISRTSLSPDIRQVEGTSRGKAPEIVKVQGLL
jgi:hypothetical protein